MHNRSINIPTMKCTDCNRMDNGISVKYLYEPIDLSLSAYSSVSNWTYSNSFSPLLFSVVSHCIHSRHSSICAFREVSWLFFSHPLSLCRRISWTMCSFPAAPTVTLTMRAKSSITRWKEITSATWLRCRMARLETVSKMIHSFFVVCHYILDDINFLFLGRASDIRSWFPNRPFQSLSVCSFSHVLLLYM